MWKKKWILNYPSFESQALKVPNQHLPFISYFLLLQHFNKQFYKLSYLLTYLTIYLLTYSMQ